MAVRVDKWLQIARVFKTRTRATNACTTGKVRVNGITAKAHKTLSLEDRVEIQFRDWKRILVVKRLPERAVRKTDVPLLFDDLSPPRPRLDPVDRLLRRAPEVREKGKGRPTKKERRQIERLKRSR